MLFLVHYEVEPKDRDTELDRFRTMGEGLPPEVTALGHWCSVTELEGWVVLETSDPVALTKAFHSWTDLNVNHITPVIEAEEQLKMLKS